MAKHNISRRPPEEKPLRAREPRVAKHAAPSSELELDRLIHEKLRLAVNPDRVHFFDSETEAAI